MFKRADITTVHIEITTRCQALCPMCPRTDNPNLPSMDWTLDDFKQIFPPKVLTQLNLIYFCGNYGDPIMNSDLPLMCSYVKETAPHIQIDIHTNGGARSKEWWQDLYNCLPQKHTIVFALDGLADTHSLYRVNTSFTTVLNNAKTFIDVGGNAHWVFIRFKHNQHQVNEARLLAKQNKFSKFVVKDTTRFGLQETTLEPPTDTPVVFFNEQKFKDVYKTASIECYALKHNELYIDATKTVYPCCYLGMGKFYNSKKTELENIFTDQTRDIDSLFGDATKGIFNCLQNWNQFEVYWNDKKLIQCVRVCGDTPLTKPTTQWKN